MAITASPKPDDLQPYTVTRALCMGGERVEVGSTVHLTITQGTELASAGKVTPGAAEAAAAPKKGKAAKAAADAQPADPAEPAAPQDAQPAE